MNRVILIGNLTRNVELSVTANGITVAKLGLAVQRKFKSADGEIVTDFFNIVVWRELADLCAKFLSKGKKVAVIGNIQTRSYDGEDGTKRHATDIIAEEIEFLTPRNLEEQEQLSQPSSQAKQAAPTKQTKKKTSELQKPIYDDGLPF